MRLLEHRAKALLADFGIDLSMPSLAHSAIEAEAAAARFGAEVVVKAQIPRGGRGKAGAIKFAASPQEAGSAAAGLLGTEVLGNVVTTVTVEPKFEYTRELYLGVTWDTVARLPVALLSCAGGVEVESAAESMVRRNFDPRHGLRPFEGREMAAEAGLGGKTLVGVGAALEKLCRAFLGLDAVTLEINPLVEGTDGKLIGLDAHLEIEDDAVFRHKERLRQLGPVAATASGREPTPLEAEASRIDALDHRGVAGRVVEFDGDLALLIGGGGASLTVFDAIRRHGGKPANYCEVGGNPTEEKVAALTALLLGKPGVRRMAVIMNVVNNTRADVMARGVLMGVDRSGREPAETISVFRIPGSWEDEAVALLSDRGVIALGREFSLDACARLAVEGSAHAA